MIAKKQKKNQKAPEIIVRQSGRGVTRREAHDKANVGFRKDLQRPWVEKVGWSREYEEGWDRIFGKKEGLSKELI